jgi:hypothetical protein
VPRRRSSSLVKALARADQRGVRVALAYGTAAGHVPAPVQITDHIGDSATVDLLREVLLLTKMNWNSARFAGRIPVTLRFAKEVGAILRDLPDTFSPESRYAFYM